MSNEAQKTASDLVYDQYCRNGGPAKYPILLQWSPGQISEIRTKISPLTEFSQHNRGYQWVRGCVSTKPISFVNFQRFVLEPWPKKRQKTPIFTCFTVVPPYRASDPNAHVSKRSPPRDATLVTSGPTPQDARFLPKSGTKLFGRTPH